MPLLLHGAPRELGGVLDGVEWHDKEHVEEQEDEQELGIGGSLLGHQAESRTEVGGELESILG